MITKMTYTTVERKKVLADSTSNIDSSILTTDMARKVQQLSEKRKAMKDMETIDIDCKLIML